MNASPAAVLDAMHVRAEVSLEHDRSSGARRWSAVVADADATLAGLRVYGRTFGCARANLLTEVVAVLAERGPARGLVVLEAVDRTV